MALLVNLDLVKVRSLNYLSVYKKVQRKLFILETKIYQIYRYLNLEIQSLMCQLNLTC